MTRPATGSVGASRIGIFGGTFNPVHLAHLRSAQEVLEWEGLRKILFIPSAHPPHKRHSSLASAEARFEMVRLAIAGNPRFEASAVELERIGHSYSVDTLRVLRQRTPRARFTFIIGLDAFREVGTWKEHLALFSLCDIVVTSRPNCSAARLRTLLPIAARRQFCYGPDSSSLVHESGHIVRYRQISGLDISATDIRRRVQEGMSIRYLVPDAVERYITRNRIYSRRTTHT